jgi:hypothetical protein
MMRTYSWLTNIMQQRLIDQGLVEASLTMIRSAIMQDGKVAPFDDSKLVYELRHNLLPFLDEQVKYNEIEKAQVSITQNEEHNEFLQSKPPIPFEKTRETIETNHETPVLFIGEQESVRKVLAYASDLMSKDGLDVVFVSGSKITDLSLTDKKYPVIKYGTAAHLTRNNSQFKSVSQHSCVGADVVIVEDIYDAISKKDQELTVTDFNAHYKKITRWAKEGKVFIVGGMRKEQYLKYMANNPMVTGRFSAHHVAAQADGNISVGEDTVQIEPAELTTNE